MRTYKLTIAYDGTAYQGWQRQANTENTLQGTLERTISSVAGYPVEIDGSGRTDAGVHANGQTATVVLSGRVEDGFFTEKINSRLPEDIRILDAELVRNGFHARKSAVGKKIHLSAGFGGETRCIHKTIYISFSAEIGFRCDEKGSTIVDWHV